VRFNVASHTCAICEVLGMDNMHSLINAIQILTMDNHWRIRHTLVQQAAGLAKIIGVEMFQQKLEALYMSSLYDSVHSVREAGISHLQDITEAFGCEWTVDHLLPKLMEQYSQSSGYVNRVTTLHALPRMSLVMSPEQVMQFIVPVLIKATKDVVPNVRFCACRNVTWMLENHPGVAINAVVKPVLQTLESDADTDVQYYAQRAVACCN